MINIVLEALKLNTRVEVLYIQVCNLFLSIHHRAILCTLPSMVEAVATASCRASGQLSCSPTW